MLEDTSLPPAAGADPLAVARAGDLMDAAVVNSPFWDAWSRFRRNWAATISLATVLLLFVLAICAPLLHTTDPLAQHYAALDLGPNAQHWFGTDGLGRDQYSRLLYGLHAPLLAGLGGALITALLGTLVGVVAGYCGGVIDAILARLTDLVFAFPGFTLALIVVSFYGDALRPVFGDAGRLMILIIVFAVVGWPGLMRFTRSLTLSIKEQQFIEAARLCGTPHWKIITRHVLPGMWGMILVQTSFVAIGFVYTEAVLSIFGLGIEPPAPDLGQMLFSGASNMGVNYWEVLFPSAFLIIIFLAFTFLADGMRDAFDPHETV